MLAERKTLERKDHGVADRASSSFGQHREVSGS
jgi:hypothetical protein